MGRIKCNKRGSAIYGGKLWISPLDMSYTLTYHSACKVEDSEKDRFEIAVEGNEDADGVVGDPFRACPSDLGAY